MQIAGRRLIQLLTSDGWVIVRSSRHGAWLRKNVDGATRFTTVKNTREIIPQSTLKQILGPKQTGLGAQWLQAKLPR